MKITKRYEYWNYQIIGIENGKVLHEHIMNLIDSVWTPSNTLRKVFEIITK